MDALNQIRTEVIAEDKAFVLSPELIEKFNAMIHPFGDGNGRTARLIEFYLLLLKKHFILHLFRA